jgi:hypothetical protein
LPLAGDLQPFIPATAAKMAKIREKAAQMLGQVEFCHSFAGYSWHKQKMRLALAATAQIVAPGL